jgi:hypothetical protein
MAPTWIGRSTCRIRPLMKLLKMFWAPKAAAGDAAGEPQADDEGQHDLADLAAGDAAFADNLPPLDDDLVFHCH